MEAKEFIKDKVKDLPHAISSTTLKGTEYGYTLMGGEIEEIANEFALIKCKEMASNMKAVDKFGFVSHAEEFIPKDLLTQP